MKRFRTLAAEFNKQVKRIVAGKDNTIVDEFHGTKVADPYRGLEDLDAGTTSAWVNAENKRFARFIKDVKGQDEMVAEQTQIQSYDRETLPVKRGKRLFNYFMSKDSEQMVFQVRDHKNAAPRALIDPNKIDPNGTTAISGLSISPDGTHVAYLLSEAGSDAQTLYIKDVATGQNFGTKIENCRFSSVNWDQKSNISFKYTYPADDDKKRFVVKHHTIGNDYQNDPILFEAKGLEESFTYVGTLKDHYDNVVDMEYGSVSVGTNKSNALYLKHTDKEDAQFEKLFDDGKSSIRPIGVVKGLLYAQTDLDAPNGRIVRIDLKKSDPKNWETLIEPQGDDVLQWAMFHKGQVFVNYGRDTADAISVYSVLGKHRQDVPLPPQSTVGFAPMNKKDKEFTLSISNFQTAGAQYTYDIAKNTLTFKKKSSCPVDLMDDVIVERIKAKSKDGTMVPMTVIRRKDVKLDGSAATKLYGYGGFNVPLTPGFSFSVHNWVKEGGVYVQANLRGGGEFGSEWYDQGRLLNKQNVFDDFIACAEHLIKEKITSPARLSINGGSNGGLLTLATMLQRPELFGAVTSHVPVTDMYRFHKFTYGAAWKSDYGDIEGKKADFNAASKYSPLHNVKSDVDYPPTLVLTGDHDDRVVPSHAYKFVATMNEKANQNSLCLLRVEKDAGHGAGKSKKKAIRESAEEHAFLVKTLGPIDQQAYKKAMSLSKGVKVGGKRHP